MCASAVGKWPSMRSAWTAPYTSGGKKRPHLLATSHQASISNGLAARMARMSHRQMASASSALWSIASVSPMMGDDGW